MTSKKTPASTDTVEDRRVRLSRTSTYVATETAIALTDAQKAAVGEMLGLQTTEVDAVMQHIEAELSVYAFRHAREQEILNRREMLQHTRKLQAKLAELEILLRDLPGPMRDLVAILRIDDTSDIDRLRDDMGELRVTLDCALGKAGGAGRPKSHALYALVSRMLIVFTAYSEEPPQYWWDGNNGEWGGNFQRFVDIVLGDVMRVANSSFNGIIREMRQQATPTYLAREAVRLRSALAVA